MCSFNAVVDDDDLVNSYLPAFEACVREAHVSSIMCSYNAINGVPSCADGRLNQQVMREQWGVRPWAGVFIRSAWAAAWRSLRYGSRQFDGYIVSDCGAIYFIEAEHNYTHTVSETCYVAMDQGGCDVRARLLFRFLSRCRFRFASFAFLMCGTPSLNAAAITHSAVLPS